MRDAPQTGPHTSGNTVSRGAARAVVASPTVGCGRIGAPKNLSSLMAQSAPGVPVGMRLPARTCGPSIRARPGDQRFPGVKRMSSNGAPIGLTDSSPNMKERTP